MGRTGDDPGLSAPAEAGHQESLRFTVRAQMTIPYRTLRSIALRLRQFRGFGSSLRESVREFLARHRLGKQVALNAVTAEFT
jgi:hypothetical protein